MANLTISIDDDILRRARMRALEIGVSLNAVLRDYLTSFSRAQSQRQAALERLLQRSKRATSGSGPEGRSWRREDLYDR